MAKYSDKEKAAVYIGLQANEGNVARTARETGIPKQTVRDWKQKWENDGPPEFSEEMLQETATAFVERAEQVRDKLLVKFEEAVDAGLLKPEKMPVAIGILDDKVRLHKGLVTSRSESTVALPSAEEVRELFSGLITGAISAATERQHETIELDEQSFKELEPAKE